MSLYGMTPSIWLRISSMFALPAMGARLQMECRGIGQCPSWHDLSRCRSSTAFSPLCVQLCVLCLSHFYTLCTSVFPRVCLSRGPAGRSRTEVTGAFSSPHIFVLYIKRFKFISTQGKQPSCSYCSLQNSSQMRHFPQNLLFLIIIPYYPVQCS